MAVTGVGATGGYVDSNRDSSGDECVGKCHCHGLVKVGYVYPDFLAIFDSFCTFFVSTGSAIRSHYFIWVSMILD